MSEENELYRYSPVTVESTDGLGDWRIAAVTRLPQDVPAAFPGGPSHKRGTPVYQATVSRDSQGQPIGFIAPSPAAMALDAAFQGCYKAETSRGRLQFQDMVSPNEGERGLVPEAAGHLFDYLEAAMQVVVFSFLAVESYCNEVIERKLEGTMKIKRKKGVYESWDSGKI